MVTFASFLKEAPYIGVSVDFHTIHNCNIWVKVVLGMEKKVDNVQVMGEFLSLSGLECGVDFNFLVSFYYEEVQNSRALEDLNVYYHCRIFYY